MNKFSWPFGRRNEGASLIAVVTAIVFVVTIGTIVLTVTLTNIRMREVEESGKHNFYGADGIMEELASGLNDKASGAMRDAYTVVLEDYRNSLMSGTSIQQKFTYLYMDNLRDVFKDTTKSEITNGSEPNLIYAYGYYSEDDIKAVLSSENQPYFIPVEDTTFSVDFVDGIFTLHNLRVDYTDTRGYETVISTDMVFHAPSLNFGNNSEIEEYMKYALISDVQIGINGSTVSVDGNMYAGYNGINVHANASNVTLTGTNIVTRGDINVNSGSTNVKIGGDRSNIWAENVTTTSISNSTDSSSLTLQGNIYVSDDLTLGAAKSEIKLIGNYYGYNFRKQYDRIDNTKSPEYSSAIVINGKNARLDMTGLDYLMLAGRTYIARGSNESTAPDVVFGESLSVRTNQLAYYVPDRYLEDVDGGGKTLKFGSDADSEGNTKAAEYANYLNMNIDVLKGFLKEGNPVLAYRFLDSNAAPGTINYLYRYYLNFKDDQAANDFFVAYSAANGTRVNNLGKDYADAIIIDDSTMVSLQGDIMSRDTGSDSFTVKPVTITNQWDSDSGVYYNYADQMAKSYMSLQKYLEDWSLHSVEITSDNVRFADKKDSPVTSSFVDFSLITANSVEEYKEDGVLIVVAGKDYEINDMAYEKGIVIATGNVKVYHDFTGMIIAGGTIELVNSTTNIKADEMLVGDLFKEDALRDTPRFSHLFFDYGTIDENVLGLINIDKYQTYENWTRTEN